MAKDLFNKEDYAKALVLFDEIMPYFKASTEAELLNYMYAYCLFSTGNNIVAAHRFKLLYDTYPYGKYAEESLFNYAYCTYLESPDINLDQTSSALAIEAFQLFINKYPDSKKVEESNKYIDEMYSKIERKDIEIAKLYYKIQDYKAAIWTLSNVIDQYPAAEDRPELIYLVLDSYEKLIAKSVESKKKDRLLELISFYSNNLEHIKNTAYFGPSEKIYKNALIMVKKI